MPAQARGSDGLAQTSEATTNAEPSAPSQVPQPTDPIAGWAPPPTPIHGPGFRDLSKERQAELIRVHRNLGHPAPLVLAHHLKVAGFDPDMVEGAKEYQCDTCLESTEPRHQKPAKLHEPREFNDTIGLDGFHFHSRSGYRAYVIHVLDEASCFHLAKRTLSHHAHEATKTVEDLWLAWAGNPKRVYLDQGGEFRSEVWIDFLQSINAKVFLTARPWQRGRVEQHGDTLKHILHRFDTESVISNELQFDKALLACCQAKNCLVRKDGYSLTR